MIDMDYEQKYNEALERAKAYHRNELAGTRKEMTEYIFPELAESEDERIRKGLVKLLTVASEAYLVESTGVKKDSYLAYLEKQKKNPRSAISIPADCASNAKCPYKIHGDEDFIGDIKDTPAYHFGFDEGVRSEREKQKEQKPTSTEDMSYVADEHFYEQEPVDSFKYRLAEYMTKNCTRHSYNISSESILKMAEEELLKRGVVQKPAEWSEEDENMLWNIISIVGQSKSIEADEMLNWLKSLRPQPKVELSEDVKKTLDEVSHILIGLNYKQVAKDYKQAIEKLLSLRPSWKPSEEQMEALRVTIDFMPDTFKPRCTLITLQNGLEKLM